MDRGRDKMYFIFAVMPIFCLGIDTRVLSGMKYSLRTENNSYSILGDYDESDFRDKYLDVLYRFVKSNRNSYMPRGDMQRTLRSFETRNPLLTSIKREKEVYENLKDLQFYGSEIPKKFIEKRLASSNHFASENAQQNTENKLKSLEQTNLYSDKSIVKSALVSGLRQKLMFDNSVKNDYQPVSNTPELSNVPVITDNFHLSETTALKDTSELSNLTTHSMDGKNVVIAKRQFPSSRGARPEEDVCNMDDLEIDIRFREMMDTTAGSLLLTCTGSVVVKKCEGACNSQVKPSVNNYDGFERQCSCCKDSAVTRRTVRLTICTLGPEEVHGYSISRTIVEPLACSCQECRN